MTDYYASLGVSQDASQEEIKTAFRRLARDTHPDANPNDPAAEARFREIAEAYEVLSDPKKRSAYDRGEVFGGANMFANFAGLDEILQQFFGGGFGGGGFGFRPTTSRARGSDVVVEVELTLEEAATNVSRELQYEAPMGCESCEGIGVEPGYDPIVCSACGGAGQVQISRNTFLGSMMTVTPCIACRGRGNIIEKPCRDCRGTGHTLAERSITVEIPAGVDDGMRLRLAGRGAAGAPGASPGDLYVEVRVIPDPRFDRVGDDLHYSVHIGFAEATFGTRTPIPLINGDELPLDVPPGTQPGTIFQVPRRGMPRLRRRGYGDLIVSVTIEVPDQLTTEAEDALRSYASTRGEQPLPQRRRRSHPR